MAFILLLQVLVLYLLVPCFLVSKLRSLVHMLYKTRVLLGTDEVSGDAMIGGFLQICCGRPLVKWIATIWLPIAACVFQCILVYQPFEVSVQL